MLFRGSLLMSLPVRCSEVVAADAQAQASQPDLKAVLRRRAAEDRWLKLLRKLPVWVAYLLLLTFHLLTTLDFPSFLLINEVVMSFPTYMCASIR